MPELPKSKKRGPKPEVFKVSLAFEDAVEAALKTPPPKKPKAKRAKK